MPQVALVQPLAEEPAQQQDTRSREALVEALRAIIGRLQMDADKRVNMRQEVERRWIDDLRQLRGRYDDKTTKDLQAAKKSTLFINQTLPKTNACEARLSDMMFPTDDKNWGIRPTPVPELTQGASEAVAQTEALVAEANEVTKADPAQAVGLAKQAQQVADIAGQLKRRLDEAKKRADAMQDEIEDQLIECSYSISAREVIQDACKVGTGIMKGPVGATDRVRRTWGQEEGSNVFRLKMGSDPRPAYYRTDYWSFFPDTDARSMADVTSIFERHIWTEKDLRTLAKQPGFDRDAIRRLLTAASMAALPTYLTELRAITGENQATTEKRYIGWEYRGPLTAEDMRTLCQCLDRTDIAGDFDEVDPLDEINVVLWFCNGEVLKFGLGHMDSGESIYSVYNLEKDDSSIWGYGIPFMMRDSQKALSGAWRMMMDNSGLSSGPQIEIDRSVIDPADGEWVLTPRKIWLRKAEAPAGKTGITPHDIESHQPELQAIILLAKQFIDEETSVSVLAQGEQGTRTTQTASGMALLMNAVNVVFRRFVKNFDDDLTVPCLRRLYDWNMQFSDKEHIKGDFQVDARGTSVLLVREIQSQNLMVLANLTSHPVLGILLQASPILRKLAQSMMIPADEIVKSDEDIKRMMDAMAKAPQEDPAAKLKFATEQMRSNTALQIAQLNRDTEMMKLAEARNMKLEDIQAILARERIKADSGERKLAVEVAVEQRMGAAGAGSGGYVSNPGKPGKKRGKGSGGSIP